MPALILITFVPCVISSSPERFVVLVVCPACMCATSTDVRERNCEGRWMKRQCDIF